MLTDAELVLRVLAWSQRPQLQFKPAVYALVQYPTSEFTVCDAELNGLVARVTLTEHVANSHIATETATRQTLADGRCGCAGLD